MELEEELLFRSYLSDFEEYVAVRGVVSGKLGSLTLISPRPSKLHEHPVGVALRQLIQTTEILAVDYYGFTKKSWGLICWIEELRRNNPEKQIRTIKVPVVYFSKIKIEDISELAPYLVSYFPTFKQKVLNARMSGEFTEWISR